MDINIHELGKLIISSKDRLAEITAELNRLSGTALGNTTRWRSLDEARAALASSIEYLEALHERELSPLRGAITAGHTIRITDERGLTSDWVVRGINAEYGKLHDKPEFTLRVVQA